MIRIWTIENSKDEFYKYDKNSNRITLETYTTKNDYAYYKNVDNGNTARVMYDGKWWYTYDANGNRTARARNAEHNGNVVNIDKSDEYWEYEWDYHNRLVKVKQYNAPDNSSNVCVEYTYDALNRRIERISRTKTEPEVTQYAYGRNGALTYQEKTAGSSVTTRSFVYLNNQITGFMDTENGTESIRYAVTDIQGSVTEVYDENNRLLWKSGYTAFGIKAGETTNLIDFEGLYTGCDIDAETGLTYHWNRWRSEDGSTWLSQDPARDGLNWYGYAGQNPVNYIDVIGLFYYNADGQYSSSENYEKKDITSIENSEPKTTCNTNSNLYEEALRGLQAMINLDFGTDWGNAAAYSFKNKNFILGILQEFNGMAEAAVDLGLAYFGAAFLGAAETGLETAITTGSLTSGFIDGQKQFQNSTDNLIKSFIKVFNNFTSNVSDRYKATSGGGGITKSISLPKNDAQLKHIFRKAPGHLIDSSNNRRSILDVANNKNNYLGTDKRGNDWYHKINDNGEQIWVRVRNGVIDNAGVNTTPRIFNSETGLYKNLNR